MIAGAGAFAVVAILMGLGVLASHGGRLWPCSQSGSVSRSRSRPRTCMGMPWRAFRLLPGYCLAFAYAIGLMVREAGVDARDHGRRVSDGRAGVVVFLWSLASIVLNAFDR